MTDIVGKRDDTISERDDTITERDKRPFEGGNGYIARKQAVKAIFGVFVVFVLLLGGGLQLVKKQAEDTATRKASALASATAEATRYNANRQTCLARTIVDAQIAAARRSLAIAQSVAADKGRSSAIRATARANVRNYGTTLDGLLKFRNTYGTIPPNYDCTTLPKDPPPLATNGGNKK